MSTPDENRVCSVDLLRAWAENAPNEVATFHRNSSAEWEPTTWSALWLEVQRAAVAFAELGLAPGDRLGILARTCREWQLCELAGALAGASVIGIDPNASGEQIAWIAEDAGLTFVIVDTIEHLAKIPLSTRQRFARTLVIDARPGDTLDDGAAPLRDAIDRAPQAPHIVSHCDPNATAILIYTSGTTGAPKGIEYTHEQLMIACRAMLDEFPDLRERNRFVCWLPMSALFQRMINLVAMASRSVTYFVEDPRTVVAVAREVHPTVFFAVPRFYEKLHEGIRDGIAKQTGIRRRLAETALAVGIERARLIRTGRQPGLLVTAQHAVLEPLVLRKIRDAMGGEIKWMITGSAAAPAWLLESFHGIGWRLLEAYGITENPVPIAANKPAAFKLGSVGKPFAMNDIRLSDDGEVQVRGPAVFRGYRGQTPGSDIFTADGYYRTGDIGRFDDEGFLFLTGRISELIKTSTGRRISVVGVEEVYRQSRYVDQIVVIGRNRPCLTALVSLNAAAVNAGTASQSVAGPKNGAAVSAEAIRLVEGDLETLGERLAQHERVRAFRVFDEAPSVENGLITATLKLRRDRIEARYADLIDEMYVHIARRPQ